MPAEASYLSGMNERQADGILKVFDSAPVSLAIIFFASPAGDMKALSKVPLLPMLPLIHGRSCDADSQDFAAKYL